jgi:threonyl-tRNA synthetase
MVTITLPDGSTKEFKNSVSPLEIAQSISEGLARISVAAKINGELSDLTQTIKQDADVQIITTRDEESLHVLRHSVAHIFSQAVMRLYPKAKRTIGPATEQGFFYDFDCDEITEEVFPKIEEEMKKIVKEDLPIEIVYRDEKEALAFYKDNKYKQEIIKGIVEKQLNEEEQDEGKLEGGKFKFYKQAEYEDLCTGPHLPRTGMVKAFKLEKVTKAYWRADAKNKQLNRVYGSAFWKKSEMDEHYEMLEEAKKRDHRVLGKQLQLFMGHEYAPGMTFFLPKGFAMYKELQNFIRGEYRKREYQEVMTPNMFNKKLWETSGHWQHYQDDMFVLDVEGHEFALKPMNCPSHCLIFKNSFKSYKELPLRIADFGALHRNELSGALSGLTRVRKFCQDDAHIFCTPEQIEDEIIGMLDFADYVYNDVFGMHYDLELSTRPEEGSLGSDEVWEKAEAALENAMKKKGKEFKLNPGDGAFYGPKIDFKVKDSLGRVHQTATVQLDFNLPERFELKYEGSDNSEHRPVMIHRAVLGSVERFMAIMIEHFAGKFPLWLSPTQVKILNIADRHIETCDEIKRELEEKGFRVETNYDHLTMNNKVRQAQEEHPNYIIIIGDKDQENGTVSVRDRKNETTIYKRQEFFEKLQKERDSKSLD